MTCYFHSFHSGLKTIPSPGKSLNELDISGCDVQSLPQDFFHHGLEVHIQRDNRQDTHTISIKGMEQFLKITANILNLKTVPTGKSLTHLYIYDSYIEFLPHDFFHHHLEKVVLNGNKGERNDK